MFKVKATVTGFGKDERDNIYPSLGQRMVAILVGELEVLGYVDVKNDKVTITDKGKEKLDSFIRSLTAEEKEALKLQTDGPVGRILPATPRQPISA